MAVFKTALREGVLTTGSLTEEHATFFEENATGEGMSKRRGSWDVWDDEEE